MQIDIYSLSFRAILESYSEKVFFEYAVFWVGSKETLYSYELQSWHSITSRHRNAPDFAAFFLLLYIR